MTCSERYQTVKKRILESSIQRPLSMKGIPVNLIAVSKSQSVEAVEELYHLGQRDFGENYAQELVLKATALGQKGYSDINWHFMGHLQTNKVKMVVPFLASVHSLDSLKLAAELAKRWTSSGRNGKLPIFIEVNVDAEQSKSGVAPSDVPGLMAELNIIPELMIQGLMCVPASGEDPRAKFILLRELERKCHSISNGMLSMGMSSDFELAIQEGSTHVRVGTALFGTRHYPTE